MLFINCADRNIRSHLSSRHRPLPRGRRGNIHLFCHCPKMANSHSLHMPNDWSTTFHPNIKNQRGKIWMYVSIKIYRTKKIMNNKSCLKILIFNMKSVNWIRIFLIVKYFNILSLVYWIKMLCEFDIHVTCKREKKCVCYFSEKEKWMLWKRFIQLLYICSYWLISFPLDYIQSLYIIVINELIKVRLW